MKHFPLPNKQLQLFRKKLNLNSNIQIINKLSAKVITMENRIIDEKDATSHKFLLENYKGLVFDCDGTLVNSMEYFFNGWETLCKKHELVFSKDRFYSLAGTPVRKIVEIILEDNNKTIQDSWIDSFIGEKREFHKSRREKGDFPTEITCVTKIVKDLHGKIPMAVASSGAKVFVHEDLQQHDLIKYFDAIVTVEDVENGKPAPDLFLEACKRIKIEPTCCLGYEDANIGIQSLHAAKMHAVNVTKFSDYPN